jgi:hypothetical protein
VLNGVGAESIIALMMGRFIGINAEIRANHGMISPESGCTHESDTIFL